MNRWAAAGDAHPKIATQKRDAGRAWFNEIRTPLHLFVGAEIESLVRTRDVALACRHVGRNMYSSTRA
jgi:hypothetical protein